MAGVWTALGGNKLLGWLAAAGAALLAILAILGGAKRAGRQEAENEALRTQAERARQAAEARNAVAPSKGAIDADPFNRDPR